MTFEQENLNTEVRNTSDVNLIKGSGVFFHLLVFRSESSLLWVVRMVILLEI